ncbi:hypothetical protein EJB05_57773, partial [Eragrostis curvula]
MDPLSMLAVRFHVKGEFLNVGRVVHWIGGSEVMSYIDRDKVSYPEIVGHLRDHMEVPEGTMLHWLFPGMELSDGLTVLWDDNSCLKMSDAICDGGVADIYVECRHGQGEDDADNEHSDFEDEMEHKSVSESEEDVSVRKESREEAERQVARLREFYSSPTKKGKQVSACDSAVVTEASQGVMTQASQPIPTQASQARAAAAGTETDGRQKFCISINSSTRFCYPPSHRKYSWLPSYLDGDNQKFWESFHPGDYQRSSDQENNTKRQSSCEEAPARRNCIATQLDI